MGYVFSVSQIFADQCEQEWAYRYLQKLKPIRVRPEMDVGTFAHLCIAAHWGDLTPKSVLGMELGKRMSRLSDLGLPGEQVDELEEEMHANADIAWDVFQRWGDQFRPDDWEMLYCEEKMTYNFSNGDEFWSIVDFVGVAPDNGTIGCIDWKVRASGIQDPDRHAYPLQQTVYAWILGTRGINVDWVGTFQMRGKISKDPKINKNGSISRAATTTTWGHYKRFVEEQGLDPDDYLDMKEKQEAVEWFREHRDVWSPDRLEKIIDDVVVPRLGRLRARYLGRKAEALRTGWGTAQCTRCMYADLCAADLFEEDFPVDEVFEQKLPRRKDGKV